MFILCYNILYYAILVHYLMFNICYITLYYVRTCSWWAWALRGSVVAPALQFKSFLGSIRETLKTQIPREDLKSRSPNLRPKLLKGPL